ncbi:transposase [Nocardioides sp. SYSU D00038]|uniref:transposase n=1 Tax=Nocardioides sp. SYSU D00038 TaxID=2812554 RepID=UPI001967671C|nr:transposase [Nocardioides sp. SYSU D00038]
MRVVVVTADQRSSRSGPDLVPALLRDLAPLPHLRAFERTAGDEVQGVLAADELPAVVELLLRDGGWNVGIGVGPVDPPLPDSTRAGRGPAFLLARDAVTAAKTSPWHLRALAPGDAATDLETVLWLWAALLGRRTRGGWEVADLLDDGLTHEEAAERLGVTPSAVTQRARTAAVQEGRRARATVAALAAALVGGEVAA